MKSIYAVFRKLNRIFAETTGYLIALIVILLVVDTFGVIVGYNVPTLIEMAIFAVIASAYLGLSYAEELHSHVTVDFVISKLPALWQMRMRIIWGIVSLAVITFTAYAAYLKAYEAFIDGEAIAGEVPIVLYPIRTLIAICLIMYMLQILFNLILDVKNHSRIEPQNQ